MSQNRSKITNYKKITTKQSGDRHSNESSSIAAATSKRGLKENKSQKRSNTHTAELTTPPSQIKRELDSNKSNIGKETNNGKVDCIVNKELIALLDSVGVPVNKTIRDLLKLYPVEKVESAIAIVRTRKRDQYIPNLSGYFVAALKGDWGGQNVVSDESDRDSEEIDKGAVFRHWYELAKELGYCSGQEIREGEQWVNLSGSWEKWEDAVKRGYSLSYLKKIIKRNNGR